ncbi:hypothetical protein EDC01DRAFT_755886 [Geopyxis carbonaria]|nr:hypothetical protein EDC01DRAFT_755886 [Geopyxis carbonaria]
MAKRKKNKNANHDGGSSSKRAKQDTGSAAGLGFAGNPHGYLDQTTGQRGAFPGLDNSNEDFYGPCNDGIDYLRMVRSEAKGVPSLLLGKTSNAPPPPRARKRKPPPPPRQRPVPVASNDDVVLCYDDEPADDAAAEPPPPEPAVVEDEDDEPAQEEEQDTLGAFEDSTYISLLPSPARPSPPDWHAPLLSRYLTTRQLLHSALPPPSNPPISIPWKFGAKWLYTNTPTPKLLWALDQARTLALIKVATKTIGAGTRTLRRGVDRDVARWIWSLLVRVDESLPADDMCVVRALAKAAMKALKGLQSEEEEKAEMEALLAAEEEDEAGEEVDARDDAGVGVEDVEGEYSAEANAEKHEDSEPEEGELDELSAPPEAAVIPDAANADSEPEEGELDEPPAPAPAPAPVIPDEVVTPREDTVGVLDMIIAIVGDHFGQRDILEERIAMLAAIDAAAEEAAVKLEG